MPFLELQRLVKRCGDTCAPCASPAPQGRVDCIVWPEKGHFTFDVCEGDVAGLDGLPRPLRVVPR